MYLFFVGEILHMFFSYIYCSIFGHEKSHAIFSPARIDVVLMNYHTRATVHCYRGRVCRFSG